MGLKVNLGSGERMIINGALVRAHGRVTIEVENRAVILRAKDLMSSGEATTPARQLYFATMSAYIDEDNRSIYHDQIVNLVRSLMSELPIFSVASVCVNFAQKVACQDYYLALADCRELIAIEDTYSKSDTQPQVTE
jgi:flagellar protein FlbT